MKQKIKRILKVNRFLYIIYGLIGSLAINLLKIFVRTDQKMILFVSYGGKKYDDSPKAIFEYISNSKKYKDYKCVWAFEDINKLHLQGAEIVKIDSIKYYITVLKAKYWVSNTSVKRGLTFTKQDSVYLNTWHGTPIKKLGHDINNNSKAFKSIGNYDDVDIMLAQSNYEVEIFSRAFLIPKEKFLICGLPRNDELVHASAVDKNTIKHKMGIKNSKKIILYAPTFRDDDRDKEYSNFIAPPIDLKKWKDLLGHDYILMIRAHHEVSKILGLETVDDFVVNVSDYQNLNDLMIISDLLISDYSSIFFDYSILNKPMICFAYDYEKYKNERGMYLNLEEELPGEIYTNEDQLINAIRTLDYEAAGKETEEFKNKYIEKSGNATEIATRNFLEYKK